MDAHILLVEDDPSLVRVTTLALQREGFRVTESGDGREALDVFGREAFDLVLLDVMLPGADGFEVCREIRRSYATPIVMLTARADTTDVVVGLELGADDYLTKPFEVAELIARVRAVLRRGTAVETPTVMRFGDLEIDEAAFRVTRRGEDVALTATEFRLLCELVGRPGQVFTREVLLERVWSYRFQGDSRLVDVAMRRLRTKIEVDPAHPLLITTVRGVGYRFDQP